MSYGPLHRIPTVDFGGKRTYAYVNPKLVSSMEPDMQDEGEGNSARTITGTRLVTSTDVYFVPLSVHETALKLDIKLEGQESEASV